MYAYRLAYRTDKKTNTNKYIQSEWAHSAFFLTFRILD